MKIPKSYVLVTEGFVRVGDIRRCPTSSPVEGGWRITDQHHAVGAKVTESVLGGYPMETYRKPQKAPKLVPGPVALLKSTDETRAALREPKITRRHSRAWLRLATDKPWDLLPLMAFEYPQRVIPWDFLRVTEGEVQPNDLVSYWGSDACNVQRIQWADSLIGEEIGTDRLRGWSVYRAEGLPQRKASK